MSKSNLLHLSPNIRNLKAPTCKTCVHMIPSKYTTAFSSPYNRCKKFGDKDLVSGEIVYYYANDCRKYKDYCGQSGIYYELEPNLDNKMTKHQFTNYTFVSCVGICVSVFTVIKMF